MSCSKGRPGGYSREAQRHQETGAQHRSAQRLPPPHTPTHTLTRTSPLAFCPPSSVPPSSRPIFPLIISRSAAKPFTAALQLNSRSCSRTWPSSSRARESSSTPSTTTVRYPAPETPLFERPPKSFLLRFFYLRPLAPAQGFNSCVAVSLAKDYVEDGNKQLEEVCFVAFPG